MPRTAHPDLVLNELHPSHARDLYDLLQKNRDHLTVHGDYAEQIAASCADLAAELADNAHSGLRFGIFLAHKLIGRIDLVPVDPPRYSLGYWLDQSETGKGYATAAVRALAHYARDRLKATDLYAGVTYGNERSVTLLMRTGFVRVADFEKYTRYHLVLRQL